MNDSETLYLLDTSLTKESLTIDEKIILAKKLEKLQIDIIEVPAKDKDTASTIAQSIKDITVAITTLPLQKDINEAWDIIKNSAKPRLRLILSPDLIKEINFNENGDKQEVIKLVKDSISYAKTLTEDVEFILVKTQKIHKLFLFRLIETAAEAGAKTVTISDAKGKLITDEVSELFEEAFTNLPDFENLVIGASCHNKLGLANANTLSAVMHGAKQIEITAIDTHFSNDTASLQDFLRAHELRDDLFKQKINLNPEEYSATCEVTKKLLHHLFCEA